MLRKAAVDVEALTGSFGNTCQASLLQPFENMTVVLSQGFVRSRMTD